MGGGGDPTSMQTEIGLTKTCFVICPIGEPGSEIRQWSDDIYENLIKPICADFGYHAFRIIDASRPGEITQSIIAAIYQSDLVIADLTPIDGHAPNPNVMYEVALRHASTRPFIHLSTEPSRLPFDVGGLNAVQIRGRFGGMDATRKELADHIRAIEQGRANGENPVSRYLDRQRVEAEGGADGQVIAKLMDEVADLHRQVAVLNDTKADRAHSPLAKMFLFPATRAAMALVSADTADDVPKAGFSSPLPE